ncbi:MAG: hypothetical protein ACLPN6_27205 [Streptosporangiaceae bacterium]|jgi:hypothetical protein
MLTRRAAVAHAGAGAGPPREAGGDEAGPDGWPAGAEGCSATGEGEPAGRAREEAVAAGVVAGRMDGAAWPDPLAPAGGCDELAPGRAAGLLQEATSNPALAIATALASRGPTA